jgi:hypothetical protein
MKKLIAVATMMFVLGAATVAAASVIWPAKTTSFAGVNTYLNSLHATDVAQFSRIRTVSAPMVWANPGYLIEGDVPCPTGWQVTGGGVMFPDQDVVNNINLLDYFVSKSGPNGVNAWRAVVRNPTYNGTDPVAPATDFTVYVVCIT